MKKNIPKKDFKLKDIKPIELVACLQHNPRPINDASGKEHYFFYTSDYNDININKIEKIGTVKLKEEFDLILIDNNILFIGHWNSGICGKGINLSLTTEEKEKEAYNSGLETAYHAAREVFGYDDVGLETFQACIEGSKKK